MPGPARYTSRMTEALSYHREFELSDETATLALGSSVAGKSQVPQVIFLRGDLGAGKTTFSRGFLRGRGHDGSVKSPTYTLLEPYSIDNLDLYHFDLYRLESAEELEFVGFEEILDAPGIKLFEWPQRAEGWLPSPDVLVQLALYQPATADALAPAQRSVRVFVTDG